MLSLMSTARHSRELVLLRGPATFSVNYLNKRNAGHSEAANRKGVKEAAGKRKTLLIQKFRREIYNEVQSSKNANFETSTRLQAILTEARKSNIPTDSLQNYIKTLSSLLNKENVESYVYEHSSGIVFVVEISVVKGVQTAAATQSAFKKFGCKCLGLNGEQIRYMGIINCKPSENVKKNMDEALEDAITANCEEVKDKHDGHFEFICNESQLDDCKDMLQGSGYEIVNAEKKYAFENYISVNDSVAENLKILEKKLSNISGFVKLSHNILMKE